MSLSESKEIMLLLMELFSFLKGVKYQGDISVKIGHKQVACI